VSVESEESTCLSTCQLYEVERELRMRKGALSET